MTSRRPAEAWPSAQADVCIGVTTRMLVQHELGVLAVFADPQQQRHVVRAALERAASVSEEDLELARRILHVNLLLFMALAHDPAGPCDGDWRVLTPLTDAAIPFCHRPEPHRVATMWRDIRDDERDGRLPISEIVVRSDASAALRERIARRTNDL